MPRERQQLWRFFCLVEGYVRQIDGDPGAPVGWSRDLSRARAWELSSGEQRSEWWTGPEVDWQRCFQVNGAASLRNGTRYIFARVRVRGEELCVPAETDEGDDSKESLQHEWLIEHGWRPPGLLKKAILRMLVPCQVPFRFRELVAGRPGLLIRRARFFSGDGPASALAEWPIGRTPSGVWLWPMPPHEDWQEADTFSESLLPGPHPWCRGHGWLVEVVADTRHGDDAGQCLPGLLGATPSFSSTCEPKRRWVHVSRDTPADAVTLKQLCVELQKHLPMLGLTWDALVFPASLRKSGHPADPLLLGSLLHADLRWTQGERLHCSEARVSLAQLPCDDDRPGGRRPWAEEVLEQTVQVVLFSRHAVRSRRGAANRKRPCRLVPLRSCGRDAADPAGTADGTRPGARAVEAPSVGDRVALKDGDCAGGAACPGLAEQQLQVGGSTSSRASRPPGGIAFDNDQDAPLDAIVPHSRRLLLASGGVRQFEFHPTRPGTLLAGRKDGVVTCIDHEADAQTHVLEIDSYPILGLSWLHTQPQWAVVGASQSGTTCMVRYDEDKPGCMEHVRLEPFSHLSSLSVNCTDDFFMTSGFCVDVSLYDIVTGKRFSTFRSLHHNFINILRFSNCSPHLFATASFDHTCKLWDLREPIVANKPARLFATDTLNVMCCFSPDDRYILCSGVDKALQQFSLAQGAGLSGSRVPLPALSSETNYRRSLYLADGEHIATAATNESIVRIYATEEPHRHRGCINFEGMLLRRRQYAGLPSEEYVQSLRCHPTDPRAIGALLSTSDPYPESFIAMSRLSL